MKVILLVTSLLFGALSYAQTSEPNMIVGKGNPVNNKTIVQPENRNQSFDGTFYIITDKEAPEQFLNNIFSIVNESRKENKEVKVAIGKRSTLIIFSETKIKKENFVPVKTMIQLK